MQKPPLGLMPRDIWNRIRISDIFEAMVRYSQNNKPSPLEWIEELEDLCREVYEKNE